MVEKQGNHLLTISEANTQDGEASASCAGLGTRSRNRMCLVIKGRLLGSILKAPCDWDVEGKISGP